MKIRSYSAFGPRNSFGTRTLPHEPEIRELQHANHDELIRGLSSATSTTLPSDGLEPLDTTSVISAAASDSVFEITLNQKKYPRPPGTENQFSYPSVSTSRLEIEIPTRSAVLARGRMIGLRENLEKAGMKRYRNPMPESSTSKRTPQ